MEKIHFGFLVKSVIIGIIILFITPFLAYSKDTVESYKSSTLDYIQQVKHSLGMDKKSVFDGKNSFGQVKADSEIIIGEEIDTKETFVSSNKTSEVVVDKRDIEEKQQHGIAKAEYTTVSSYENTNVEYLGTSQKKLYPGEEKGPNIVTKLDPYHPEHEDFKVPYYKDRKGLKIHPWVGVRGEYKQDEKLVPIQSLIMEAKDHDQTTDSELRDYISTNDKHYTREELILHYKETWPKFTFIHHNERVTRKYEAKKVWSSNDMLYDHNDKKYYKLEYTIPNLPKIGYLKLAGRYGSIRHYQPNDNAAYKSYDSYQLGLYCMPIFDAEVKLELTYNDIEQPRWIVVSDGEEYKVLAELKKIFPRHYLTIVPHYEWKNEEYFPLENPLAETLDEWEEHKGGVRIEKEINGDLEFKTDWTYINFSRDYLPDTAVSEHTSVKALTIENDLIYEIIRDLKFTLGYDYGTGLDDFDGFDNYTVRGELMYRKPGLADWRIGIRHTEYYNISDEVDTLYFKIGFFM